MSRRSNGLVAVWAEAQRQQQRRQEAQRRAGEQARRDQERQQRDTERAMARMQRERRDAYRQQREADARRRTEELDARMAELSGLLADGCRAPAFTADALRRPEYVEAFAPGRLAVPIPMPDPAAYPPQATGWSLGGARRAQAQEEARARYEHDWHAAQAAEAQRLRQLEDYRRQYDQWAAGRLAEIRNHNAAVGELLTGLRGGDPDAVVEYFSAALYAATGWPQGFPRRVHAAFDAAARQLVLDWELPGFDIVPATKSVRYMYAADQDKDVARPVTQRRAAYRDVLAQSVLLVLHDLFTADPSRTLDSVVVNGFVDDVDPVTGRPAQLCLATVTASRDAFEELHLAQVSAVDCLTDGLRGRLSARPEQRSAVRPARQPGEVGGGVVTHGGAAEPDLFTMDPIAFEGLVAELFRAMGMQAVTTQRSGDGGVDVDALDSDPIRGGKIIVQVKRYRNTVPPTAVRDLFGTVQSEGANKGVLVTTSRFGPGAHAFANGKPLTLVSGPELHDLLARHGLRGRLGAAPVPAQRQAPAEEEAAQDPDAAPEAERDAGSILGMNWSGSVSLDVCALVCQGNRVLSDDHFVFYNNPRTPDGTVRMLSGFAPDRAAVQVAFDALPATADRLVLVAAVDPETDPHADLSGFTDACIRLVDASGTELGQLEVSDGRSGETALVLGSFRRRANGDWDFVLGGKGYEGGLEALVQEYGIEVA
ncbi:restriction endonuclease [Streptomyces sp. NPDC039022]|uniref:restriction endonuclease n=1 Tax=Streptomyces sp. NPDC039022 TaxID=3157091 RepID=UPI0033C73E92